jgi:hypothetical protein
MESASQDEVLDGACERLAAAAGLLASFARQLARFLDALAFPRLDLAGAERGDERRRCAVGIAEPGPGCPFPPGTA